MAENTTTYKTIIETDVTPSIAELKRLQKELKTTTDPARFKELQQKIDDTKEAISAARTGAGNFAEVLGTLPGPIGDIGARAGSLIGTLKTFGQVKFSDLKGSFIELGKDIKDIGKGFLDLTGITKIYTTLNQALSKSFVAVGIGEQAAAAGARTFAAALTATGIGAIVVGLGLLIANWEKVTDAIKGATLESKTYDEAQAEVTKGLTDFNKKLKDIEGAFAGARAGTIRKEDALKKYNDTLGSTIGYAGSLEQAEQLLAENTAVVVEGIKLRTQANVFYAKSAEAAAKAVSGEDIEPSVWQTVGDFILSGGNSLVFASNQAKTFVKNYSELSANQKRFEEEGDALTQKAIENDKKLKKGLAEPPDNSKKDNSRKQDLENIKKNSEAALLAVMEAGDKEVAIVNKKYDEEIALAQRYGKSTTELEAARLKELGDIKTKYDKEAEEKRKENDKKIKEEEDKRREERILSIENEIQLDEQKYTKLIAFVNDRERMLLSIEGLNEAQRNEIRKQAGDERLAIQNQRYDEQIANINAKEKELLSNTELNEAERTQIQIEAENARKELRVTALDDQLLNLDTEYNLIGTSFDRKRQLINEKEALLLSDASLSEAQRTAIQKQASDERTRIALAEKEAKAEIQMAELDLVQQGAALLKEIAGKNKKLQIAAVIVETAAAIGKIAVNTGIANAKAVAALPLTAGQPFVTINTISGILAGASAVAASVKAIQQINSAESGASATSTQISKGASPSVAAPKVEGVAAPQVQTGGGQNPTQQIATTIAQAQKQPIIKTYVTAQDVSSVQAFNRRTNNAASF